MKKLLFLTFVLLVGTKLFAQFQPQKLSEQSEISLLTISPGEELWSFAGHTAIRVKDPVQGIDVNFNYGVFDFRKESFYLKFLRGTLPYEIGAYNFRDETPYWISENRKVTQQVLNLNQEQKQRFFDFLMENYQPENREYRYKFFYDNCSTRVRDVLEYATGDSLQFSQTLNAEKSFRDWIKISSQKSNNDWSEFGMDLLIGVPADETTNAYRAMFIPDNLMAAFDSAKIKRDGEWIPLVQTKYDLNMASNESKSLPIKPFMFFAILFLAFVFISYRESQNGKWYLWLDKVLFTLTGLCGFIFLLLWFFTDHGVTEYNWNVFWALPILFPLTLFVKKKVKQPLVKKVFLVQMVMVIALLLLFKFLPQTFNVAILPIAGIVLMRSYLVWKRMI
ncbi:DUF4105 domain-containing protein [Jiulongibacter sediminis]|uniref:lipoprotein N-acyltransferase Lnb domain-containing protein n=1 Tax=Jiulongibacter sediminis TaxID=1605367 RepID=UPI0026F16BF2|nr:DUF4105 domain-containing protein [Jiulongibacter sediminis]